MKVNRDRWEVLSTAIQAISERTVTIYEVKEQFGQPAKKYGINWSACGTVTVEETKKFRDLLDMGIEIADILNYHEVQFVYTDELDPEIDSQERFEEVGNTLITWILAKNYNKIEAWIISGSEVYAETHKKGEQK